jgi:hypothetical protein
MSTEISRIEHLPQGARAHVRALSVTIGLLVVEDEVLHDCGDALGL